MSGKQFNKFFVLVMLLSVSQNALAAELFGIQLASSTTDQLIAAVKQAGATVIKASDEGRPYDIFDSVEIIPGSSKLTIGQGGKNRQIAFVEYEFPGLKQPGMLKMMTAKYGAPAVREARFLSDKSYFWEVNGVRITFRVDWQNYRTLVSYVVPEVMSRLQNITSGKVVDSTFY